MHTPVTTSSGQAAVKVIDYSVSPPLTEATGQAILAQLHVLQEQMMDVASTVSRLVDAGERRGVVATQGQYEYK